ncbi:hypothetical protein E2C01_036217 [Portunus trituberculatus]|uniref:Uncharacterized protein n=1 Tax=Portunus trituberculatus TaxID=210409 RepID=A0A5B7FDM6_PORTR|nr:hypothetical protein [Portunus trituberculatus]
MEKTEAPTGRSAARETEQDEEEGGREMGGVNSISAPPQLCPRPDPVLLRPAPTPRVFACLLHSLSPRNPRRCWVTIGRGTVFTGEACSGSVKGVGCRVQGVAREGNAPGMLTKDDRKQSRAWDDKGKIKTRGHSDHGGVLWAKTPRQRTCHDDTHNNYRRTHSPTHPPTTCLTSSRWAGDYFPDEGRD